jgi:hypothetical protein
MMANDGVFSLQIQRRSAKRIHRKGKRYWLLSAVFDVSKSVKNALVVSEVRELFTFIFYGANTAKKKEASIQALKTTLLLASLLVALARLEIIENCRYSLLRDDYGGVFKLFTLNSCLKVILTVLLH